MISFLRVFCSGVGKGRGKVEHISGDLSVHFYRTRGEGVRERVLSSVATWNGEGISDLFIRALILEEDEIRFEISRMVGERKVEKEWRV